MELPVVVIAPETLIASPPVKLRNVTFPPAPALVGVVVIAANWVFPDEAVV